MFITDLPALIRMGFHPGIWKMLGEIRSFFASDPHVSLLGILKSAWNTAQGEKIVPFNGGFQVSSFLPPLPSESFLQVVRSVGMPENPETYFLQQGLAQRGAPISFFLSLTSRCTFNCFHCSARGRPYSQDLSTVQWKEILRQVQSMGTAIVGFTGGEPLTRPDLEELVATLDRRTTSYLFTSGMGLTPERAAGLKAAGLYGMGISLDSWNKEDHDRKRGLAGAADLAWKAVGISRKAGLYTLVQTMIPRKELSKDHVFRLLKLARRLGAHELRILEPMPCGKLSQKDDQDMFYTSQDREFLIRLQHRANRRPFHPKMTTFAHTESFAQFGCGAGTQHSYITSDGFLTPCDFVPLSFGSVVNQDLSQVWKTMNRSLGKPKKECFAHTLRTDPVHDPLQSLEICQSCRTEDLPRFYNLLLGKDSAP